MRLLVMIAVFLAGCSVVRRPVGVNDGAAKAVRNVDITPYAAWDFSVKDLDGNLIKLSDYGGSPLVLVFYLGGSCAFCVKQLSILDEWANRFLNELNAQILAVSSTDEADVRALKAHYADLNKKDFDFKILSAGQQLKVFRDYGLLDRAKDEPLHGLFLINGDGEVIWRDISHHAYTDIESFFNDAQRLLK